MILIVLLLHLPISDSPKDVYSPTSPSLDSCNTVLSPEHLLITEKPMLELSAGSPSPTPIQSTTLDANTDLASVAGSPSSTPVQSATLDVYTDTVNVPSVESYTHH